MIVSQPSLSYLQSRARHCTE